MKLFTKQIDNQLFAQYPLGADLSEQKVVAKIFNPYGRGTWYLINSDPNDPDYLWAIVDLFEVEVGSVSRMDLETIKVPPFRLGLERDMSFEPKNAEEVYRGLLQGKRYEHGGSIEDENKQMVLNQAEGFEHHAEELEAAAKKADHIPAWVVAKSQRASTDLSDITHYLDGQNEQKREMEEGEEYKKGGLIGDVHSLTDELLSQKIQIFLDNIKPIKYYYIDQESNMLVVGLDENYKQDAMDKLYKEATSSMEFFDADSVDMQILPNKEVQYRINLKKSVKFANGGETEEGVDLFEDYDEIPENVQNILDKNSEAFEDGDYRKLEKALKELKKIGYTFEYGLDGQPYDLRKIGQKGKSEFMANGGEIGVDKHRIYFSSFAEVMDAINDIAEENGYNVVDIFPDLSYGGVGYGQTKRAKVELEWNGKDKMGKSKKREKNTLNVQIYRMDSGNYELNSYFSYAHGGMTDWQKAKIGDNALVISENKLGVIVKDYGRKFHLKFPDGREKTYDASELKFIISGGYMANGGKTESEEVVYIEYLNKAKKFAKDKKEFKGEDAYKQAISWGRKNIGNFNPDMVKFKMADGGEIETYSTLSFKLKKSAEKNEKEIKDYYSDKLKSSEIIFGKDERGNHGYYVKYHLKSDKFADGGYMADGGSVDTMATVNEIARLSGLRPIAVAEWGDKNNINLVIVLKDLKSKKIKGVDLMTAIVGNPNNKYSKELLAKYSRMAMGGVTFKQKVKSIKSSLLKRKKVSPKVQKDYGKTYSKKEAQESAERIVGAMTAKERLMKSMKKGKK